MLYLFIWFLYGPNDLLALNCMSHNHLPMVPKQKHNPFHCKCSFLTCSLRIRKMDRIILPHVLHFSVAPCKGLFDYQHHSEQTLQAEYPHVLCNYFFVVVAHFELIFSGNSPPWESSVCPGWGGISVRWFKICLCFGLAKFTDVGSISNNKFFSRGNSYSKVVQTCPHLQAKIVLRVLVSCSSSVSSSGPRLALFLCTFYCYSLTKDKETLF